MQYVKETVTQDNDEVAFRNFCAMPIESFLELVPFFFYLCHTFVGFNGQMFIQKSGVFVGSKVAPILSSLFLAKLDQKVQEKLPGSGKRIFRFIDDYLVLGSCSQLDAFKGTVLSCFKKHGNRLNFACELLTGNKLQFLDLTLSFDSYHTCYMYAARSE